MLRATPNRLNRFATIAVLPLLVFGAMLATRASESASNAAGEKDLSGQGLLVVANLQSQDLTLYSFGSSGVAQTLQLPGPPHEIARLGDRLYVTLGRKDLLVEVDPFAPGILRTVALPGHPHGIAIDSRGIHVSLDDANEVVTLDWSTLEVTGRLSVGDTPHVVATRDGVTFVTDSRDGFLRRIDESGQATVAAGLLPEAITVAGHYILVADADGGQVLAFDADTLAQSAAVELSGRPVRVVAHGSSLLVARNGAATFSVLSLPSLVPVADVNVGPFPDGICFSPSGRFVATPTNGDGRVVIIDAGTWKVVGTLPAGVGPGACAWIEEN